MVASERHSSEKENLRLPEGQGILRSDHAIGPRSATTRNTTRNYKHEVIRNVGFVGDGCITSETEPLGFLYPVDGMQSQIADGLGSLGRS